MLVVQVDKVEALSIPGEWGRGLKLQFASYDLNTALNVNYALELLLLDPFLWIIMVEFIEYQKALWASQTCYL